MAIPITIISGFLGAGKTTLVNNLLASATHRLAVLVNDFAALNIDAELIRTIEPDRIALTNGCVCCTLRDDLVAAALQLAALDPPPDRIVLETSGIANPYGVMEAFYAPNLADRLTVDRSVCVVDAAQFPELSYADGELAIDQAALSDLVLLNKCDLVSDGEADAVEATLLGALPAMRITRSSTPRSPLQSCWTSRIRRRSNDHITITSRRTRHGRGWRVNRSTCGASSKRSPHYHAVCCARKAFFDSHSTLMNERSFNWSGSARASPLDPTTRVRAAVQCSSVRQVPSTHES